MANLHPDVNTGTRWRIAHGSLEGCARWALIELQRAVQTSLPYVLEVRSGGDDGLRTASHLLICGTPADNPLLAELVARGLLAAPQGAGGYSLAAGASPWAAGCRFAAIAGSDAAGVLNGTVDFLARIHAARLTPDDPREARRAFDAMPDFAIAERPAAENRGIWTWGYVLYDHRRFFDRMARLKLNMVCIWNDVVPVNAAEVVACAHARGIKVIFGFHWGWGIKELDLGNPEHLRRTREAVLRIYREQYRGLGADGIYFQTATEHDRLTLGGRTVAALARDWVNDIARALLAEEPGLLIQFGLHAISIGPHAEDLAGLDERVTVVWEDAGAIPYSYEPLPAFAERPWYIPPGTETAEQTLDYSRRLAAIRPGAEFALVPKGWIKLRWGVDFEHHGPFVLGERDPAWIRRRLAERQPRWDAVNRMWLQHFPAAARFYREILACRPARLTALALVEDGMFEERIQPSVALFAQTLWNPHRPDGEILDLALSPYYAH